MNLENCGDNLCIFGPSGIMGTNDGCQCLVDMPSTRLAQHRKRAVQWNVERLRERVAAIDKELTMRSMMKSNEVAHRLGITVDELDGLHSQGKAPLGLDVGGGARFYRRNTVDLWAKSSGRVTPNDWKQIDA